MRTKCAKMRSQLPHEIEKHWRVLLEFGPALNVRIDWRRVIPVANPTVAVFDRMVEFAKVSKRGNHRPEKAQISQEEGPHTVICFKKTGEHKENLTFLSQWKHDWRPMLMEIWKVTQEILDLVLSWDSYLPVRFHSKPKE